jgi:hypothetical protein
VKCLPVNKHIWNAAIIRHDEAMLMMEINA